jgi:hypothetical protein
MCVKNINHPRRRCIFKIIGVVMSITAAGVWLSTNAVLLLRWGLDGFIQYNELDGEVVLLSNVCAKHKPGSISGTLTTSIPFFLTVLFTKLYYDWEIQNSLRQLISLLAVVCAFVASVSLVLMSILDLFNHRIAHFTFLGLFIVFIILTSVLTIIYRFNKNRFNWVLAIHALLIGMFIPLIIIFIVAVVVGVSTNQPNLKSVAGSDEWSISVLIILYFALFAFDF